MRRSSIGFALIGALAAASASAQTPRPNTPAATSGSDAVRTDTGRSSLVEATALESGATSFTEGQARSRIEDAGFRDVQNLRKDDAGFWRGRASRGGTVVDVALDFRGRIAAGPAVAQLGGTPSGTARPQGGMSPSGTMAPAAPGTMPRGADARPDGTPGNPPSTMTGRAVDRMQGQTPQPDGTPGNPAGTAAGRALDRATTPAPAPTR